MSISARARLPVILTIALILFVGPAAQAKYLGTIITKSGEEYKDVSFKVNRTFKAITIDLDGKDKNISFDNIEVIYDPDGNNITGSVIGSYYKPKRETWRSETDPHLAELREKPWVAGFRLAPNFSIPIGGYYWGIDPGIGYEGDIWFAVTEQVDIRFTVSRSGMRVSRFFDPIKLSAVRYVFSLQYHGRVADMIPGKVIPYAYTGLGAISHRFSYAGESVTETDFITNLGGGVIVLFDEQVGVDFSANLDVVYVGAERDTYGISMMQYAYVLDFKIGLVTFL
jgi:hypothetical protein